MLELRALPALADNYIWSLADASGRAVLVDPGDAAPVLAATRAGLRPVAILLTHHHADHVGAAMELKARWRIPCHGPADPRIEAIDEAVAEGERVRIAEMSLEFSVLEVPGHTRSHVAFHGEGHLFCGDTLFSLGCGRLFEGTPAQMLQSLERLAALPDATLVCCGHEYTLANAGFAQHVEPDNTALAAYVTHVRARRAAGRPSLPGRIGVERDCNPFLRTGVASVRQAVTVHLGHAPSDRVECFAALRQWKDGFRSA